MEEFNNQTLQRFNPAFFQRLQETMLNYGAGQVGIRYEPGILRKAIWKQQEPDLWFKPTDQQDISAIQKLNRRPGDLALGLLWIFCEENFADIGNTKHQGN
ncbi:LOW QUALITY PROTEIN: Maltodextrin phosphorylase [Phytophthora palmivora]|uniref:Maltodextrin phosphorylase n=1 Tax=Phytophthora palmivora TaxID=4796 RepID=A0A2P4YKY4_9STRA|nr:LOW QUALITY PROTEIN: Maltodextrin phosphorylase [Phytophthora palmivora]